MSHEGEKPAALPLVYQEVGPDGKVHEYYRKGASEDEIMEHIRALPVEDPS